MPIQTFMVITDQSGNLVPGESTATVRNPYTDTTVAFPVQIASFAGDTENPVSLGTGGSGTGKVVFNPFTISKKVDKASQTLFVAHASGRFLRSVDILVVKTSDGRPAANLKPFLSFRLGTVAVAEIASSDGDDAVQENVSFVFGQFQIGYQIQKADGSLSAFAPVGWDLVRNVRI